MNFIQFHHEFAGINPGSIVFVSLGNIDRGDDGAGIEFLKRLQQIPDLSKAFFIEAGSTPENYLETIVKFLPAVVVFVDTIRTPKNPGKIFWIDETELDASEISTHAFSIRLIAGYLRQCGISDLKYLGIAGSEFGWGCQISAPVQIGMEKFFIGSNVNIKWC